MCSLNNIRLEWVGEYEEQQNIANFPLTLLMTDLPWEGDMGF